jgi:hypothetical protein
MGTDGVKPQSVYNLGFWFAGWFVYMYYMYNAVPLVSAALIFPAFFYSEYPLGGKPSSKRGSSLNRGACIAEVAIRRNQATRDALSSFGISNALSLYRSATGAACRYTLAAGRRMGVRALCRMATSGSLSRG